MYGVLMIRKALVLWQRCYVELEETDGVLKIAQSPVSRNGVPDVRSFLASARIEQMSFL